jgi:pSer/pThr/pTyr-binding forkhead associated (FHA) protein
MFPVADSEVIVGRDPGCPLQLTDGRVSRQHFKIAPDQAAGRHMLTDLGSANGTTLNGIRIEKPAALKDGDTIAVGDSMLRFAAQEIIATPAEMLHIAKQSERFRGTVSQPKR